MKRKKQKYKSLAVFKTAIQNKQSKAKNKK